MKNLVKVLAAGVLLCIVGILLGLLLLVVSVSAAPAECMTDTECMQMHGGDGGQAPALPVIPERLSPVIAPSGALIKFS